MAKKSITKTPTELIKRFTAKYSRIVEELATIPLPQFTDINSYPIIDDDKDGYAVLLICSNGIGWHTDVMNEKYCYILVLKNPGYVFKRKLKNKNIETHRKAFFSFELRRSHGLFWNRKPLTKVKRKNWIALAVDSVTEITKKQALDILSKSISTDLKKFTCFNSLKSLGLVGKP
jgi:hypothetical protein